MRLNKTFNYSRIEKRFFKKHKELLEKYRVVLKQLQKDPFEPSLKTHKLKGSLNRYYSCSLDYRYRIILIIEIIEKEIILINIGSHDDVYK